MSPRTLFTSEYCPPLVNNVPPGPPISESMRRKVHEVNIDLNFTGRSHSCCRDIMELNYDDVYDFLTFHRYPTGFSKNQKRVLRRKSHDHFRVKRGLLFYSTKRGVDGQRREWRQIPRTVAEQERIIRTCHSSVEGKQAKLSDLALLPMH